MAHYYSRHGYYDGVSNPHGYDSPLEGHSHPSGNDNMPNFQPRFAPLLEAQPNFASASSPFVDHDCNTCGDMFSVHDSNVYNGACYCGEGTPRFRYSSSSGNEYLRRNEEPPRHAERYALEQIPRRHSQAQSNRSLKSDASTAPPVFSSGSNSSASSPTSATMPSERPHCNHSNCLDGEGYPTRFFSRRADVARHWRSQHEPIYTDCPKNRCPRKGDQGFTRKDHLKEHMRQYHQMVIPKRSGRPSYGSRRQTE